MSLESLRFMLGGTIKKSSAADATVIVRHTEEVVVDSAGKVPAPKDHLTGKTLYPKATYGHPIRLINLGGGENSATAGTRSQIVVATAEGAAQTMGALNTIKFKNPAAGVDSLTDPAVGDHIRIFWEDVVTSATTDESAVEVTISPDTFPGTYRVVGDTFMRSEKTGKDEAFQFIINKAKVASEVTLTLEAEGDPTTFEMTLNVLRSTNDTGENEMMKLVRYTLSSESGSGNGDDQGSLTPGGSN